MSLQEDHSIVTSHPRYQRRVIPVSYFIHTASRDKLTALLIVVLALASQASRGNDRNIMDPILGHQQSFPLSEHSGSFDKNRNYELSSLIELGLANNPQTRSAWFNALSSSAQVGQAKAPYFPKLSLNAQGGYQKSFYQINNGPMGLSRHQMRNHSLLRIGGPLTRKTRQGTNRRIYPIRSNHQRCLKTTLTAAHMRHLVAKIEFSDCTCQQQHPGGHRDLEQCAVQCCVLHDTP